jgi:hypothetical protein
MKLLFLLLATLFATTLFASDLSDTTLLENALFENEVLFIQGNASDWEVKRGKVTVDDYSLLLDGDTYVDLVNRDFTRATKGEISFTLRHHKHEKSLVKSSVARCFCAIKLRMGALELEIGEEWLRFQTLGQDLKVDSIYGESSFDLTSEWEPFYVRLTYTTDSLAIYVNDDLMMKKAVPFINLHDISFSSFMGVFTLSDLLIESKHLETIIVNKKEGFIDIPAIFKPQQFNSDSTLKNHHLITWENGKAGSSALFTTSVPDSIVHRALKQIGAVAGNNLTADSWNEWKSKDSRDPDIVAKGTALDITFIHKGIKHSVEDILDDKKSNPYSFVFAGNYEFIPLWESGCVVCLQSCPGSKISNASYTMRDLAKKRVSFRVKQDHFKPGDFVWIRFSIKE